MMGREHGHKQSIGYKSRKRTEADMQGAQLAQLVHDPRH